jgi:hypothetical protein
VQSFAPGVSSLKQYVMVPVPEELEPEVGRFLMAIDMRALAAQGAGDIELEAVLRFLPTLGDDCRSALHALAAAQDDKLSISELAHQLQWTAHQTVGVVQELQDLLWAAFGPKLAVVATGSTRGPGEGIDWAARQVVLWDELAVIVLEAEEQLGSSR